MNYTEIINGLSVNRNVFEQMLSGLHEDMYLWKPVAEKWCLLEIVCHLYDEEREDFRTRCRQVLEVPTKALPPIDPQGWVKARKYMQQNYKDQLTAFLKERDQSIKWLKSLSDPKWENAHEHPKFGKMTGRMFLSNWLAHDYLHIRQITKLKYDYLKEETKEDLQYAGNW